jgi:CRISPR/Cas system-associated exonuclease Cas4 (RecB family)
MVWESEILSILEESKNEEKVEFEMRDLLEKIYESINDEIIDVEKILLGQKKFSVTMLINDCLRRAYYLLTIPFDIVDPRGSVLRWIGKKLHETHFLGENSILELKLEWNGIVGIIDEYDKDKKILLEKKTTRHIPKEPYPHHIKQLEYYVVIMEKNGYPVENSAIIYIDVNEGRIIPFFVQPRRLEVIEAEMIERKRRLEEALSKADIPPRNIAFWDLKSQTLICEYCPFFGLCFGREI